MCFILSISHEKVNINQVETINAYINGFESALAVVAFMPVTVASLPPCAKAAGLCDPRNDGVGWLPHVSIKVSILLSN